MVRVFRDFRGSFVLVWGAACFVAVPVLVQAHPIERFEASLNVECSEGSTCSGIARSEGSLGRYLGVLVSRRGGGQASVEVDKNEGIRVEAKDLSSAVVTLSWDADPSPDRLSGAGLNCFDLTRNGAYAFIISNLRVESECRKVGHEGGCPVITIESRVYDARDPTGQRFSASVMERTFVDGGNLVIPFSNFLREGPRGKADLSCAGAVTMTLNFDDFESVELEFGPIFTNGSEGLTPAPTATILPTQTPGAVPEHEVSPSASTSPTTIAAPGLVAGQQDTPYPHTYPTAAAEISASALPIVPAAQVTPETPGVAVLPAIPAGVEEEVTYGEVVDGD